MSAVADGRTSDVMRKVASAPRPILPKRQSSGQYVLPAKPKSVSFSEPLHTTAIAHRKASLTARAPTPTPDKPQAATMKQRFGAWTKRVLKND